MTKIKSLVRSAKKTHSDERGLEALQVVMIIAIAAVCLLLVKSKWESIKSWFDKGVTDVTNFDGAAKG